MSQETGTSSLQGGGVATLQGPGEAPQGASGAPVQGGAGLGNDAPGQGIGGAQAPAAQESGAPVEGGAGGGAGIGGAQAPAAQESGAPVQGGAGLGNDTPGQGIGGAQAPAAGASLALASEEDSYSQGGSGSEDRSDDDSSHSENEDDDLGEEDAHFKPLLQWCSRKLPRLIAAKHPHPDALLFETREDYPRPVLKALSTVCSPYRTKMKDWVNMIWLRWCVPIHLYVKQRLVVQPLALLLLEHSDRVGRARHAPPCHPKSRQRVARVTRTVRREPVHTQQIRCLQPAMKKRAFGAVMARM